MQEPDLPGLLDNELSGLYVAAERLDLKWNYWTDYGQVLVSTSWLSANNEQQTRREAYQARRTGRQSIICQGETQIEKRESLTEGDKSVEGEEWQERERFLLYNGKYSFFNAMYPQWAVLRHLGAVVYLRLYVSCHNAAACTFPCLTCVCLLTRTCCSERGVSLWVMNYFHQSALNVEN